MGPEGAFLSDEGSWHPHAFGPHGPSHLEVEMPRPWVAASSGDLRKDGSFTFPEGHSGMALSAGPYRLQEHGIGTLRVRTLLYPTCPVPARVLAEQAAADVALFEQRFGSFPAGRLDLVESPGEYGGGLKGLVQLPSKVLTDPAALRDFLAHEVSHSWWAGGVPAYSHQGLWYEALAEFSAGLVTRPGPEERRRVLEAWRTRFGDHRATPLRQARSYSPWTEADLVAYKKGAFVLEMLRREVGDAALFEGLRRFVRENANRYAGWTEIQQAVEAASSRDLDWYFRQWLDRGDAPRLRLEARVEGGLVRGRLLQEGDPYRLSVPLQVVTPTGPRTIEVKLDGPSASFEARCGPVDVRLDPEFTVFRLLSQDQ